MSEVSELYIIRDYRDDDLDFVRSTFLKGLYHGDSWFSLIPRSIFMKNYFPVINAMIKSPNNQIKIACLKDSDDVILGFSMMSKNFEILHWVFVKAAWRKQGIGRSLLPALPKTVSHLNKLGLILYKKFPDCIFNPFNIV